jgi:hypothetical protein
MANLSEQLLSDLNDNLIGNTYPYINSLFNIDTSNQGKHQQPSKDINRLVEQMELLVNGNNKAGSNDKALAFLDRKYQSVTMKGLIDNNTNPSESHYVTLVDKEDDSDSDSDSEDEEAVMPRDPIVQLYFATLGVFGLFILYRLMQKSR